MIDEWGNDCPYDFKNIKFKRKLYTNGNGLVNEGDNTSDVVEDNYLYTFSWQNSDNSIIDSSIYGNNGNLKSDSGYIVGVYDNIIRKYIVNNSTKTKQYLNDNVFIGTFNRRFEGCYSNNLGNNCYSNNFGNGCNSNNLGNNCYSNNFGIECKGITLGRSCNNNDLGDHCYYIIFGDFCRRNKIGDDCGNNDIASDCFSINLGNRSSYNKFGLNCSLIKLGHSCSWNSFGGYCTNIIFSLPNNTEMISEYVAHINCMNCVSNLNLTYEDENTKGYNLSNVNVLEGDYVGFIVKSQSNKIVSKNGDDIKIFSFEDLISLIK
jgi:hypothetical protein